MFQVLGSNTRQAVGKEDRDESKCLLSLSDKRNLFRWAFRNSKKMP